MKYLTLLLYVLVVCCQKNDDDLIIEPRSLNTLSSKTKISRSDEIIVNNISELQKLPLQRDKTEVKVLGYHYPGDGGGGTFYWDRFSFEKGNDGTVIELEGVEKGRWKRIIESEEYSVRWFGAKGNDVHDDSVAIQKALDAPNNVFFPKGTYIISTALTSTIDNREIYGKDAILKLKEKSFSEMLIISKSKNVTIRDLYFNGNYNENQLDSGKFTVEGIDIGLETYSACLKVDSSENILIKNVHVKDAFIAPIVLNNSRNCEIKDSSSKNHVREGLGIRGGQYNSIVNCHGESINSVRAWSLFWTSGIPGEIERNHHHTLSNNTAINAQGAFISVNTTSTTVKKNIVFKTVGSQFTSGAGIRLGHLPNELGDYRSAKGAIVIENIITGLTPTQPFGLDSGNRGISIDNGTNSIISGNIIENCNAGIGSTLRIDKKISILNNEIRNVKIYGIHIDYGKSSVIEGNLIEGASEGIRSRQEKGVIRSNDIKNFSKYGIGIFYGASENIRGHQVLNNVVESNIKGAKNFLLDAENTHEIMDNVGY